MEKKHIGIIVFCLVFLALVILSWTFLREKPQSQKVDKPIPTSAVNLDLTAQIVVKEDTVTSDHLIEVSYRWETGPSWTVPAGNTLVFVHLQDDEGVRICQDDHTPPVPVSNWQPGMVYEYSRLVFIPITLLKKKVFLLIGFYNSQDSSAYYALKGLPQYNPYYRYLAKELTLLPSREEYSEALIKYRKGWYGPEIDKNGYIIRRWMQKRAEGELVNPGSDAVFYINAWVPNEQFEENAVVTLTINDHQLELPEIVNNHLHTIINVPADLLGDAEYIPFVLESSQSFVPAKDGKSTDNRELGILIKKIMFRGVGDKKTKSEPADNQGMEKAHVQKKEHKSDKKKEKNILLK